MSDYAVAAEPEDQPWEYIRWARAFMEKLGHGRPSVVDREVRDEAVRILTHYPDDEWIEQQRANEFDQ